MTIILRKVHCAKGKGFSAFTVVGKEGDHLSVSPMTCKINISISSVTQLEYFISKEPDLSGNWRRGINSFKKVDIGFTFIKITKSECVNLSRDMFSMLI